MPRAVVVLTCPWQHVILWPRDIEPYPSACLAHVATTPESGMLRCGKALTYVRDIVDGGAIGPLVQLAGDAVDAQHPPVAPESLGS